MKHIYKIILSVIALYGLYLVWSIFTFGGGCNKMDGEIHYIPKNYIGKVSIIFNFKDGVNKEYKNSNRLYIIPSSGQLKTKFKLNHGWTSTDTSHEFYYVDNDSIIPIRKLISTKDFDSVDSNLVYILEYGIGTGWEIGEKEYDSNTYIVDTLKNLKKY